MVLSDKNTFMSDILVHIYLSNSRAQHGDYTNGATMFTCTVLWPS